MCGGTSAQELTRLLRGAWKQFARAPVEDDSVLPEAVERVDRPLTVAARDGEGVHLQPCVPLGADLRAHAFNLGAGGTQRFPGLRGLLPGQTPRFFNQLALLLRLLARLPHRSVFRTPLIQGH